MAIPIEISELTNEVLIAIKNRKPLSLEFLYIRADVLLFTRMTAEKLRNSSYEFRFDIRGIAGGSKYLKSFVAAISKTSFTPVQRHIDIRYGFIVHEGKNREILAIFMDYNGHFVQVNNKVYGVTGDLTHWFKEFARTVVKIA